jgi:co-chaperonin GroES (HSP10)
MFNPVNRYILFQTESDRQSESEPLIVLPEDFKPQGEKYRTVRAVRAAEDVRFPVKKGQSLIIDWSMAEEITIGATIYNVVLDNYVVGIVE